MFYSPTITLQVQVAGDGGGGGSSDTNANFLLGAYIKITPAGKPTRAATESECTAEFWHQDILGGWWKAMSVQTTTAGFANFGQPAGSIGNAVYEIDVIHNASGAVVKKKFKLQNGIVIQEWAVENSAAGSSMPSTFQQGGSQAPGPQPLAVLYDNNLSREPMYYPRN